MAGAMDVITRGRDSSNRVVKGTRQCFQRHDRMNKSVGGKLVIVQGAFNVGVSASAGTHDRAGAFDWRTWNLTKDEQFTFIKTGRLLGGADWLRYAPAFDPHAHGITIGDVPMHPATAEQVADYRAGRNGLSNNGPDDFPFRPAVIKPYQFLEDDMFEEQDRERLIRIEKAMEAEKSRDQKERERDKARFTRSITALGELADDLGLLINRTTDAATKQELRRTKEKILLVLKDDPDVTGVDNPSDDEMP